MRSWRWWFGPGALPVWGALFLFGWAGFNTIANRRLRAEFAAIHHEGFAVHSSELAPPWVEDDRNGAILYDQALALVPKRPYTLPFEEFTGDWTTRYPAETRVRLEGWIEQSAAAIDRALRGAALPACRWPIDYSRGISTDMPGLLDSLNLAIALSGSARLAWERGDRAAAAERVTAMFRFSSSFRDEPLLIMMTISGSLLRLASTALQQYLSAGGDYTPALRAALESIPAGAYGVALSRCLQAERAVMVELLLREYTIAFSTEDSVVGIAGGAAAPYLKGDIVYYSSLLRRMAAAAKEPPERRIWQEPRWEQEVQAGGLIMRIAVPGMMGTFSYTHANDAVIDLWPVALEGLALAREKGTWPERWPALETGRDRLANAPWKVKREGDSITLWGVGQNLQDDGADPQKDIVIKLYLKR